MRRKRVLDTPVFYEGGDSREIEGVLLRYANGENVTESSGELARPMSAVTRRFLDTICATNANSANVPSEREVWPIKISWLLQRTREGTSVNWSLAWSLNKSKWADFMILSAIVDLTRMGRLSRLLKCHCGQYFVARVDSQRFHSAKCREKAFKSTPEWKTYRNQKAREYYQLHKSGRVK